jgi:cell division protein ZapA
VNHTIQPEKQKLNVELFGQKYTFRAEADERQKLLDIAGHVDYMMHKIGDNQPKLDYRDVAVLAAMNIAEEYYQLQQDYQALIDMIDEEK